MRDGRTVELEYVGINNDVPAMLSFSNSGNIDHIVAEIVYKGCNPGSSITVQDASNNSYTAYRVQPSGASSNVWVYRTTLNATSSISYSNQSNESCAQSLVAYVFRNQANAGQTSGMFIGKSGYNNVTTVDISIPTDAALRDLTLFVPMSEMTTDGRYIHLSANAGGSTASVTERIYPSSLPNGCCIKVFELQLNNVPANANTVTLTIDTRHGVHTNANGQSWVLAAAVYTDIECVGCNNVTDAGEIGYAQEGCSPFNPAEIVSLELPSGGSGDMEYVWLRSTDGGSSFTEISGTDAASYNPGVLNETTWFRRCARRLGCEAYVGESNWVKVAVNNADFEHFSTVDASCAGSNGKIKHDPLINAGTELPYTVQYSFNGQLVTAGPYSENQDNYIENLVPGTYYDVTLIDANGCEDNAGDLVINEETNCIEPPTAPNCAAGNFLWENNIDVNNLSGSAGIPQADLRMKDGVTTQFLIPGPYPTEFDGPVTISIDEVVSWDAYQSRASVGDQPNEQWKLVFKKDGAVVHSTGYTNDLVTGTTSAEWVGSLGTGIEFTSGVDEIYIVHYEDAIYGAGSSSSPNSVVPTSVCISYEPLCDNANISINASATDVSCDADNSNECEIVHYQNGSHAVWLVGLSSGSTNYKFEGGHGTLVENEDGTGHFSGTVYNTSDANKRWLVDIKLNDKKTWTQWSGAGGDWKGNAGTVGNNYQDWAYYEIASGSRLIGLGDWAGQEISIARMAAAQQYRVQVGIAANDKNGNYGLSAWFDFAGSQSGHGDFNFDIQNCVEHGCDATATASASGGTAPYTYVWDNGMTTSSIDGLCAGQYCVSVVDANGCTSDEVCVTIGQEGPCCDNATDGGEIAEDQTNCGPFDVAELTSVVDPSGGTGNLEIIWITRTGTSGPWQMIQGSTGLTYNPGVVSTTTQFRRCARREGCADYVAESNIITITIYPTFELECNSSDASTWESSDGTVGILVNGGTAPYTYLWNTGATTASISNVPAGVYSVTVIDANGCEQWAECCVKQPAFPDVCIGFRTQTPGGWGAVPNGGNPGAYLHANFASAFPSGIEIGCTNKFRFTTAQAITDFLPCGGTATGLPAGIATNPSCPGNVLANHVLAASISVGFDNAISGYSNAGVPLENLIVRYGAFSGWTVGELLE